MLNSGGFDGGGRLHRMEWTMHGNAGHSQKGKTGGLNVVMVKLEALLDNGQNEDLNVLIRCLVKSDLNCRLVTTAFNM